MGTLRYYTGFVSPPRTRFCSFRIVSSSPVGISRQQTLEQVDKELAKGDERAALSLVKDLQGKPGGLRCFGAARQVPQRLYTLDELKLNGIETASLLSPVDATLGSIERNLQLAAALGGIAAWNAFGFSPQQLFYFSLGLLFLWTFDAVIFLCLTRPVSRLIRDFCYHGFLLILKYLSLIMIYWLANYVFYNFLNIYSLCFLCKFLGILKEH